MARYSAQRVGAKDVVKDKDGISAACVFVEMAKWLKSQGLTCRQHLEQLLGLRISLISLLM